MTEMNWDLGKLNKWSIYRNANGKKNEIYNNGGALALGRYEGEAEG